MKRIDYLQRASRSFLEGSRFKAPAEAVEAGERTLEFWVSVLTEEREVELENATIKALQNQSEWQPSQPFG